VNKVINKCLGKLRNGIPNILSFDPESREFKKHLRSQEQIRTSKKRKILIEGNQVASNELGLSIFIPELRRQLNATAVIYTNSGRRSFDRVLQKIRCRFGVLNGIGVTHNHNISNSVKKDKMFISIQEHGVTTPIALDSFCLNGIRIGDLIYDTYLRRSNKPTIDFDDPLLETVFQECVSYFKSWARYLERHDVVAICISHCVYHFAIPARIAFSKNIEVFQVTAENIYRLDEQKTHAYTEFTSYRTEFAKLSGHEKKSALDVAEARLQLRFSGKTGVDMAYSTKSAFIKENAQFESVISRSTKIKVLVATHDFFDSPHSYGDNFYSDFYIWMETLGELSRVTDYEWFIKTHRDSVADDTEVLSIFIKKYPKFKLLPRDISHHQIIDSGINFALTVYGTIGMEYPALGVPVINASRNNPHVTYDFCITPDSKEEYETLILNLKDVKSCIQVDQIYEYYYMAHLHNPKSWIYFDYEEYLIEVGGYLESVSSKAFKVYLSGSKNQRDIFSVKKGINDFILSKEFKLSASHLKD
jgi:hypothetical protein